MTQARRTLGATVVAVAGMMPGCTGATESPLPSPPQVVDVVMQEYGFVWQPPSAPGRVVLQVRNDGQLAHDLVLAELPEDLPPILEQLRGDTRRNAENIADLPPRAPGSRASLAIDLAPGRYGLICFVRDPDGQQHAQKGMATEFRLARP